MVLVALVVLVVLVLVIPLLAMKIIMSTAGTALGVLATAGNTLVLIMASSAGALSAESVAAGSVIMMTARVALKERLVIKGTVCLADALMIMTALVPLLIVGLATVPVLSA